MEEVDIVGVYATRELAQNDAIKYELRNYTINQCCLKGEPQ
jgi:hypothetical protein